MATAGPSRLQSGLPPPAPSTSGDSESTAPASVEKGLDAGILKELAKSTLIEKLNDVRCCVSHLSISTVGTDRNRSKERRRSSLREHWQAH